MPYARNRRRRKKGKSKAYYRKLRDARINTAVEVAALRIAKKEVKKSHEWYKSKIITKDAQFDWTAHGPYVRVPSVSCFSLNAGNLWYLRLTDLGSILENSLYQPTQANDALTNDLRISSFRSKFDFRYAGASSCLIDISIVKVPGSQLLSAVAQVPVVEMCEPLNDLYEYWPATTRQSLGYKFQRLAHKRVRIGPARQYTDSRLISSQGSNQGYTYTSAATVHTDPQKSVTITKAFKGQGMKLMVDNAVRASRAEVYLLVVADRPIEFTGVHCTRFRLEKAADIAQPGNH